MVRTVKGQFEDTGGHVLYKHPQLQKKEDKFDTKRCSNSQRTNLHLRRLQLEARQIQRGSF